MCLHPITAISRVRRVIPSLNMPYSVQFKCGTCAECLQQKQDEWYLRTYYQTLDTFRRGGYILFDTLTYRNSDLPHISDFIDLRGNNHLDFSCFCPEDYRLFFVRLRRLLDYVGYDIKDNLKYFLTSEYGTSSDGTNRPHYHVLFFVTEPTLDPFTLYSFINRAWGKGMTDAFDSKGRMKSTQYLLKHIYRQDDAGLRKVCNYVSKYVTKDSSFQKEIDTRIQMLFDNIYGNDVWSNNIELSKQKRDILRICSQFHRQSKGYGEYALEYLSNNQDDFDYMLHSGMMKIQYDEKKVVRFIPMSKYYEMKLFWEQYRYTDGSLHWRLNENGQSYKMNRLRDNIQNFITRCRNFINNCDAVVRDDIYDLLDGRSFKDYALYKMIYFGRTRSMNSVKTGKVDTIEDMLVNRFGLDEFVIDEKIIDSYMYFNNYACPSDRDVFGRKFITTYDLGRKDNNYKNADYQLLKTGYNNLSEYSDGDIVDKIQKRSYTAFKVGVFKQFYCYDENSCYEFRNFDKISDIIDKFNEPINIAKQKTYDNRVRLQKQYKFIRVKYGLSNH